MVRVELIERSVEHMDYIGLDTLRDICTYWANHTNDDEIRKNADFLEEYVSKGNLGVKTGRGFYNYSKK